MFVCLVHRCTGWRGPGIDGDAYFRVFITATVVIERISMIPLLPSRAIAGKLYASSRYGKGISTAFVVIGWLTFEPFVIPG